MKPFKPIMQNNIIMTNTILIEKTGELKICKFNIDKDELYKKCKFKKVDNFELRHTFKAKKNKYDFYCVKLYARDTGKANTENKYDLPPPIDNILYFGTMILVAHDQDDTIVDISIEDWEKCYEDLFGGFENLADSAANDDLEEDELDDIPDDMKTKSGYLKDDFAVDDNVIENGSGTSDEPSWSDGDDNSELEYEDYSYSDEDE